MSSLFLLGAAFGLLLGYAIVRLTDKRLERPTSPTLVLRAANKIVVPR